MWNTIDFDTARSPGDFDPDGNYRRIRLILRADGETFRREFPFSDRLDYLADSLGKSESELVESANVEEMGVVYNPQLEEFRLMNVASVGRDHPTWWTEYVEVNDESGWEQNVDEIASEREI